MRAGRGRKSWDPDRVHKVRLHSFWRRRHGTPDQLAERWKVTGLFRFENGNGEMLAVRIRCSGGPNNQRVRHMSEARFLQLFVEIENK